MTEYLTPQKYRDHPEPLIDEQEFFKMLDEE